MTSRKDSGARGAEQKRRERGGDRMAPCPPRAKSTEGLRPLDEWNGRPLPDNDESATPTVGADVNSTTPAMSGMQNEFHTEAEIGISPSLAGCSFAELGVHINSTLQMLCWERSDKTMTMDQDIIYPFPLGVYPDVPSAQQPWLDAVLRGLNSLYGTGMCTRDQPTEVQKKMVKGLLPFIERMVKWPDTVPQEDLKSLFSVKGVDYRGEEVKLARSFNWEMVEGALPSGVGTLDLAEFCTAGCRFFVEKFERFLVAPELQQLGRTPRVMVADEDWEAVARGLISKGICGVMPRSQLFHVGGQPLVNGMFAVSKNEFVQGIEQHRVIMNLVPLNRLCHTLKGDVCTLPTIAGFSAFYLAEGEVAVLCSEDIKCFYYLFQVPVGWRKFMGFAKELPETLVPLEMRGEPCHLVSLVLPMGWANSVGLAQHVHRNVVRWTMEEQGLYDEGELRRDRPTTRAKDMFRVYLDNWDQIRKVDARLAQDVEGVPSPQQLALRQQYNLMGLPRHPKKAVEGAMQAEIQGALLDGQAGVAYAKPSKVLKYMGLAWELVHRGRCNQRELQIVAGGLVYISMFRRPLLSSLNAVWAHIECLHQDPPVVKRDIPREVKRELVRFLSLIPLAQMDFRLPMNPQVTASDASSTGGGISASIGLTSFGVQASQALVRGEKEEPFDNIQILSIGLFDGIGALRVALDVLELPVANHISVECNPHANRVVESAFPGSLHVARVEDINEEMVQQWALEYPSVGIILLGAGPPCQDVSRLNADRVGSQKGLRSSLYKEIPRVQGLCRRGFPWAQVRSLIESVASMDAKDRSAMSEDLQLLPVRVDASGVSLARRPRLYWCTWELVQCEGFTFGDVHGESWDRYQEVIPTAEVPQKAFLQPGWFVPENQCLATFTTSRPSLKPGRKPAGLHHCDEAAVMRWKADSHRYPPYQYKAEFGVHHTSGQVRVPDISERELILGFPLHYTQHCLPKQQRVGTTYDDVRKTLLGNSWSVPVVALLLKPLFERLGLMEPLTVQQVVSRFVPGQSSSLASMLQRAPLRRMQAGECPGESLASRMAGLVSVRGEDLMLQSAGDVLLKHQRFRRTVPAMAWRWREVTGWAWKGSPEHINQLEMRAAFTTIKWLIAKQKVRNCRVLHLVDSMVVLHALSRGRSSSRKLRRTLMRIQALLLAANLHPVWAYVHTGSNPADRPSRRIKVKKWGKVKSI